MLVNAPVDLVFVEDMDHFVPWSNPELIRDAIARMLQSIQEKGPLTKED
jgi:hypothetical protein